MSTPPGRSATAATVGRSRSLEGPGHKNGSVTSHLLTAEDLAARWQVPASQVYRLTRAGQLPVVRLGRYYRYRLDAVEGFEQHGGGRSG